MIHLFKLIVLILSLIFGLAPYQACITRMEKQSVIVPKDWTKKELENFTFYLPSNMQSKAVTAIDSKVWRFTDERIQLDIELGSYVDDLESSRGKDNYYEESLEIDGRKAKLCFFGRSDLQNANNELPLVIAIHFPDIGRGEIKLTFLANCKTIREQEIAKSIFHSIKFN